MEDQVNNLNVELPPDGLNETQEAAWLEVIQKMEEVYTTLVQDEIELVEKNAALEEAQRFINSVLSSMSDLLIVSDRYGAVHQVNAAVLKITGFSEAELQDRPVATLIQSDDAAILQQPARLDLTHEAEARLYTREGVSDLLSLSFTARRDRRGQSSGLVITGRPIGELRRAYAALESAHAELKQSQQRMIYAEKMASVGRLVAGVAHELNNPISFVHANVHVLTGYVARLRTYLSAIDDHPQDPHIEEMRKDLKIDKLMGDLNSLLEGVLEGADRASNIVRGLRRMSFTGEEVAIAIKVADVVASALTWAERGARSKIDVDLNIPDHLVIEARESQIQQVILNIIQNAFDAMSGQQDALLKITAMECGDNVEIAFEDHGPGIDAAHIENIFEPFFTTKDIGEGTGLGLWVSYDIVRAHGGDLEVRNADNGGGLFTLQLPRQLNAPKTSEHDET